MPKETPVNLEIVIQTVTRDFHPDPTVMGLPIEERMGLARQRLDALKRLSHTKTPESFFGDQQSALAYFTVLQQFNLLNDEGFNLLEQQIQKTIITRQQQIRDIFHHNPLAFVIMYAQKIHHWWHQPR